jgi:hypothetical protein
VIEIGDRSVWEGQGGGEEREREGGREGVCVCVPEVLD